MAGASLQAGLAFTNALLGVTHAISHQIGGAEDLPHGLLNAILMPHVMRFNAETHSDRYVDVARALGVVTEGLGDVYIATNPRLVSEEDARQILVAAY